jgi:hypothetical protein
MTEDLAVELLIAANLLGLERLKCLVETRITELLGSEEDAAGSYAASLIIPIAEQYNCQRLLSACTYFYTRKYRSLA